MLDQHHYLNDFSAFTQGVFSPFDTVSLTIGGRYDNYHTVGEQLSYRSSFIYSFSKNQTLRLSYGTAFRTSSYSEAYWAITMPFPDPNFSIPGLQLHINGNRDLDPESIKTYEAAYQARLLDSRLKVSTTLFFNQLSDFIYARIVGGVYLPPPFSLYVPNEIGMVNFGDGKAYGGELGINMSLSEEIDYYVNYAYQYFESTKDDPYTLQNEKNQHIRSSPSHKVNCGIHLLFPKGFSTDIFAHYVGKTHWTNSLWPQSITDLDAYWPVNSRIALTLVKDQLEVALSVHNLLNDIHREHTAGELSGRQILLSVHLDI